MITRRTVLGAGCLLLQARIAQSQTGAPDAINLTLWALNDHLLQIAIAPAPEAPPQDELGVVAQTAAALAQGPAAARTLAWGRYSITVEADPLRIRIHEAGKLRQDIRFDPGSADLHFTLLDAPVFGLGERGHSYDLTGTTDALGAEHPQPATFGVRVPIPWLISPAGWGLFVGQPTGSFVFSKTEGAFRSLEPTGTRNIFLALGDSPTELLRAYADLTGQPHLPPKWALGYLQSHRTLVSAEDVLEEARTFRDKKLPCDGMIYLDTGFVPTGWNTGHGSFTFDATIFPDPAGALRQLHQLGFKVVLHMVPPGDFLPDQAQAYWARHLPLMRLGVDGWWPDDGDRLPATALLARNQLYWDGPVAEQPQRRPFAVHRTGYAGMQRFGWLWAGDIAATWKALRAQVTAGLNTGLSGMPWWGTDIGGLVPTPELTPELFVRWFQFGAFCPLFAAHGRAWKLRLPWGWNLGTAEPKEIDAPWAATWPPAADMHRPDVEDICRKYLELRSRLQPYLYSQIAQAHETGMPVMRALWLGWPGDTQARAADDTYMWGDAMLVAPVTEQGQTRRSFYLPPGLWWDYGSGERIAGGGTVSRTVDLAMMPILVKAGAIIPEGPVRQYAADAQNAPVTLTVYPGADGAFTWYDDDGDSFRYRQGAFLRLECRWDDRAGRLTLTRDAKGQLGQGLELRLRRHGAAPIHTVILKDAVTIIRL